MNVWARLFQPTDHQQFLLENIKILDIIKRDARIGRMKIYEMVKEFRDKKWLENFVNNIIWIIHLEKVFFTTKIDNRLFTEVANFVKFI